MDRDQRPEPAGGDGQNRTSQARTAFTSGTGALALALNQDGAVIGIIVSTLITALGIAYLRHPAGRPKPA